MCAGGSGARMDVGGPQGWGAGNLSRAARTAWCKARAARLVSMSSWRAQGGVELTGDGDGELVVDFPQGADDMGESGELERGGEVDGLIDQPASVGQRGLAGRQVGQLRLAEV